MAVRPIVRYPDPILKRPTTPVGSLTDELRNLTDDLVETMYASPATVGLAAPQVGESVRAFALDVSAHKKTTVHHGLVVLFDPEILERHDADEMREGCLSLPDLTADVRRALRIVVKGLDREGSEVAFETEGFEARAVQHEVDHLDGLLILDRVRGASAIYPRRTYG
ncbi:MAG: peptide deformylase [Actinomycetota bacterium]